MFLKIKLKVKEKPVKDEEFCVFNSAKPILIDKQK